MKIKFDVKTANLLESQLGGDTWMCNQGTINLS